MCPPSSVPVTAIVQVFRLVEEVVAMVMVEISGSPPAKSTVAGLKLRVGGLFIPPEPATPTTLAVIITLPVNP